MSQSASSNPLSPATAQQKSLDVLKISRDLVDVAEASLLGNVAHYESFARYLLNLVNAVGILIYDVRDGREMVLSEQVWKDQKWEELFKAKPEVTNPLPDSQAIPEVSIGEMMMEGKKIFAITVPVVHEGRLRSMVCALLIADKRSDLSPFIIILQAATGYLNYLYKRQDQTEESWALEQTSALIDIVSQAGRGEEFNESSRTLVNGLVRHIGCYRVCLGIVKRNDLVLKAVSGVESFDIRGTSTLVLQSAMREAVHQKKDIIWPRPAEPVDLSEMAHHELQRLLDLDKVVSVPLLNKKGDPYAVLTLMWKKGTSPDERVMRFLETAKPHLSQQVDLFKKAEPLPPVRTWRHTWGRLTRDKKRFVMVCCVAFLVLMIWPFHYRIGTRAHVQPDVKRVLAAPFDGLLKEIYVKPGQDVEADKLLARMDEKEIAWKQAELMAARDKALTQRDKAMTDQSSEYAVSQMAQYEAESYDMELRNIENKMQNLEIRAPIDGVVIVGDLKRAEGVPVTKGQVLFEIAPLTKMIAEIEIDASDIAYVRTEMPVTVKIESFPGNRFYGKILRLNAHSEVRNGRNIFIAEVSLPNIPENVELRPGMKGKAVIVSDHKMLVWILFHKVWEFFQILLFW